MGKLYRIGLEQVYQIYVYKITSNADQLSEPNI